MDYRKNPLIAAVAATILLGLVALPAFAGGPLALVTSGQPFLWPAGGTNIPFNPDQGALGPLSNADAVAQTAAAFGAWGAVGSATVTYVNAGSLAFDVDDTNFFPFLFPLAPDGLSAIVYDEDGAIFDLLFGPGSGILGFAGPEWVDFSTGDILEGVSFLNGGSLLGPSAFPIAEFLSVQVHEYGHYSNLAHTVVNGQIPLAGDTTGPTPNDTFPPEPLAGRIETMYPFLFINGGQATPHPDDIAMISTLYPEPSFFASTGTIAGTIRNPKGTAVTGINVIARNVANPFDDAVSAISSDFATDYTPGAPFVGTYTLNGLTPGAEYAVFVDQILAGGFSTPPRTLPGPEEFYNGADESSDSDTDDPALFTPVAAAAGVPQTGIDITFNRFEPGPIPLGLDQSIELFPTFNLRFCGQEYESVFVNSSGNVTFGDGAPFNFFESASGLLGGPPRIAMLWDDLDPSAGGVVAFAETSKTFSISFAGVPEFFVGGANTFGVQLFKGPSRFKLLYGDVDAPDGVSGYSCGGRVTSALEQETDLSLGPQGSRFSGNNNTAIFESFNGFDNDLDNLILDFKGPGAFPDRLEPNNSQAQGTPVKLSYSTSRKEYSSIQPLGNDIDYYRFHAKAGDILVAETVPGNQMDTLIGLFDAGGALLAFDDDGGSGLLSRMLLIVPADGEYAVAVTAFPDFGFTGAGGDFGRYVLSLRTYQGTLLALGDDDTTELPFGDFSFPFQGTSWNSVWVNSNGNFTFGAGDTNFSESVPDLLAGSPRIAALWDDLDPTGFFGTPGLVIAERNHTSLSVHFASVAEFFSDRPNYFTASLHKSGRVRMNWGATARSDAIVGVTEGNGAADPGPTDLSAATTRPVAGTTYQEFSEVFDFSDFDLYFDRLQFVP